MSDKLFTSNRKSMLFNLIGFDHRQYFELARKIEQYGGKVSLPDKFNTEAMTIINTDICYTLKYIQDSIESDSLVDAQNYCLKNILESITENNNNENNSSDELSTATMASEGDIINDQMGNMFFEDKCLGESPDLLYVENEVTDEETDEEVLDETSDRNLTAMRETVEEVERRQSPSHSLVNETFQSDDNDDIVPNSDNETIRRYTSHNNAKRQWNDRVDSSNSESGEDSQKNNKKRKIVLETITLSSTSDDDLTDDDEDQPGRSEEPLEKSENLSKKKTMIFMNRTTYLCSPPTSDDESGKETSTDKIRRKKKSTRNKKLLNKVPNEIIGSEANTNEELQQQMAPDKTECNTQETHRSNVQFNTDSNFPGTLDNRVDNPSNSSEAELINPIHAKWLDDHQSIVEKFKNFRGHKGEYYSTSEEIGIFWWLIKNDKIDQVGSENTFKQLIEDGYLTHRSWKGLYNHFRRQMLHRLSAFELPKDIYKKLKLYVNSLHSI